MHIKILIFYYFFKKNKYIIIIWYISITKETSVIQ